MKSARCAAAPDGEVRRRPQRIADVLCTDERVVAGAADDLLDAVVLRVFSFKTANNTGSTTRS